MTATFLFQIKNNNKSLFQASSSQIINICLKKPEQASILAFDKKDFQYYFKYLEITFWKICLCYLKNLPAK